jgi:hypothetical protein
MALISDRRKAGLVDQRAYEQTRLSVLCHKCVAITCFGRAFELRDLARILQTEAVFLVAVL